MVFLGRGAQWIRRSPVDLILESPITYYESQRLWKQEEKGQFERVNCSTLLIGNPLQYSCLQNPMDGGAWWAAVYGVAQSRTRLKRLSSSSSSIS